MNLPVNKYTSEYEYTYMVYVKGVIMLDSLREVVGKDKLIKALKKYYKAYSFKIAALSLKNYFPKSITFGHCLCFIY